MSEALINIVDKFLILLKQTSYRIFVFWGGRGGAKTHNMARALLVRCYKKKIRVVILREVMSSIEESLKEVIEQVIKDSGLSSNFRIYSKKIIGINGSEILFMGMRSDEKKKSAQKMKGLEGVDIVWFDEAQTATLDSLNVLIPTVRKRDSEIWFSLNRITDHDAVWDMFCVSPAEDVYVSKVNWNDNYFWNETMEADRKRIEKTQPEAYPHIYEGEPMDAEGVLSLLTRTEILTAQGREYTNEMLAGSSKIISLDVARFGDDESTLTKRQGIWMFQKAFKGLDGTALANIVKTENDEWEADGIIIEVTGVGASVCDNLTRLGVEHFEINPAEKPADSTFHNKRAEYWWKLREWIKNHGILTNNEKLSADLRAMRYGYQKQTEKIIMESKNEIKKRLGRSPDYGDGLALSFAVPIPKKSLNMISSNNIANGSNYNPFDD
ncbi:MAG: phage terminase large subunit [Endomicrobium sp.]|jgi:phage terminase large subunit|nr:phage terminase large subunit [Endomicrobium sp.]